MKHLELKIELLTYCCFDHEIPRHMDQKKKVLFVCTGNSCRSQMAEGILRELGGDRYNVYSAGSHPSRVHPMSIEMLAEWGIDISHHTSETIDKYINKGIDIVITVCDNANDVCPVFPGNVERLHWSIDDPFHGWGTEDAFKNRYRETRNEIKSKIENFLMSD